MEMILITDPEVLEGEYELIKECFELGLQDLHIRKYQASEQELLELLKRIPEAYHPRIVLHHHHYLVRSFDLKGVHFNSYTTDIENFPKGDLLFSRAVHEAAALEKVEASVDRVLLSPVYPTISKQEDRASISEKDLEHWVKGRDHPFELFALGGIDPGRVMEVGEQGFDGIAVLGSIWEEFRKGGEEVAIERFKAFRKALLACSSSA